MQFLTDKDTTNYDHTKPKAYLNYISFDNRLKMVASSSGAKQMPVIAPGAHKQPLVIPEFVVQKSGYIYVYLSNESAQKVYFDNLIVHHKRGPLLQETNYYPYGMTMAGISDKAALRLGNNRLYNEGAELQHDEFGDGTGLDWYATQFRDYNPQIGRFHSVDPMASKMVGFSPYSYAVDNPVFFNDPTGALTQAEEQKILGQLWGSRHGGWWTAGANGGEPQYYGSYSEAFGTGLSYAVSHHIGTAANRFVLPTATITNFGMSKASQQSLAEIRAKVHAEVQVLLNNLDNAKKWSERDEVAENVGKFAAAAEVVAKGGERMMSATGLKSISVAGKSISKVGLSTAGKFAGKVGVSAGLISVGLNGYRFSEGDISGTQFGISSGITTAAMVASYTLGPEAGVVVDLVGQGIIIYTKEMSQNPILRRATIQRATGPWMK